jgi:hypothetical protein
MNPTKLQPIESSQFPRRVSTPKSGRFFRASAIFDFLLDSLLPIVLAAPLAVGMVFLFLKFVVLVSDWIHR